MPFFRARLGSTRMDSLRVFILMLLFIFKVARIVINDAPASIFLL